jgi:predicted nucleotidyltransferase
MPKTTAHRVLEQLKKQGLITRDNKAKSNLLFKTKKINYYTEKLVSSGLIEELIHKLNPSCIIIFGSVRKGESVKESDIDIFVESSIKKLPNLQKYEKKLKHKIQLFIETNINNLQPNLFNNVINGIKIYGSFKIK